MYSFDLGAQLSGYAFSFLLIFCRVGAGVMLFPGIGEAFVPAKARLGFALAFTFVLLPLLGPQMPEMPTEVPSLLLLIIKESFIGIFFGSLLRLFVTAIEVAGSIIAVQIGLSNAMILNPSLASQSALPSAFLGLAAITLLFATGLDHMLIRGLVDTYHLFPVGEALPMGDVAETYIGMVSKTFKVGVEIAAPFLVVGLLLYTAVGFIQKLLPAIQLFMVMLPVQIGGGFLLFIACVGAILTVWLRFYDQSLASIGMR